MSDPRESGFCEASADSVEDLLEAAADVSKRGCPRCGSVEGRETVALLIVGAHEHDEFHQKVASGLLRVQRRVAGRWVHVVPRVKLVPLGAGVPEVKH